MGDSQGLHFGPAADLYDRVRPRYPVDAIHWILGDQPLRVVDLGAGTGILTRQLVALGHDVVPIEPDTRMGLDGALKGSAEAIPLPDGSVDAVVAGQAYHWFDRDRAHPEIARVLRPGGVFGPLWNDRDESVPWVAALSYLIGGSDQPTHLDPGELFGPVEQNTWRHSTTRTPETLVDLIRSRSYYLTASPERRAALEAAVRHLCDTHPDLAGRTEFELPYITRAFRTHRR